MNELTDGLWQTPEYSIRFAFSFLDFYNCFSTSYII